MRETSPTGPDPALLFAWYDRMARPLPWRVRPAERAAGRSPDPYQVWLSEVMLQQTTVAAVQPYFATFTARWPSVEALAAAPEADVMAAWAGLGYYARARNLVACARAVAAAGGRFPDTEAGLRALPGIGPYTAAAIAAIAFDRQAVVVDGNVERVIARLFAVEEPLPDAKPALRERAACLTPAERPGDYAQAMMDLGATVCVPRRPACGVCPWLRACAGRAAGIAAALPAKREKPAKPVRRGTAWVALRPDGAVLLEERPARGLLGGMLGLPGGGWDGAGASAPFPADWRTAGAVRHTFTHFHLELSVEAARIPERIRPARGDFHPADKALAALPTVMRKALRAGLSALG
jgi:A/G-specific adenine glycosylase